MKGARFFIAAFLAVTLTLPAPGAMALRPLETIEGTTSRQIAAGLEERRISAEAERDVRRLFSDGISIEEHPGRSGDNLRSLVSIEVRKDGRPTGSIQLEIDPNRKLIFLTDLHPELLPGRHYGRTLLGIVLTSRNRWAGFEIGFSGAAGGAEAAFHGLMNHWGFQSVKEGWDDDQEGFSGQYLIPRISEDQLVSFRASSVEKKPAAGLEEPADGKRVSSSYDPEIVAINLLERLAKDYPARPDELSRYLTKDNILRLSFYFIDRMGPAYPTKTTLNRNQLLTEGIHRILKSAFDAPSPRRAVSVLRSHGIRGVEIAKGPTHTIPDPAFSAGRLAPRFLRVLNEELPREPSALNENGDGKPLIFSYTAVGKLLNSKTVTDYLSRRQELAPAMNRRIAELFEETSRDVQGLKARGIPGVVIQKNGEPGHFPASPYNFNALASRAVQRITETLLAGNKRLSGYIAERQMNLPYYFASHLGSEFPSRVSFSRSRSLRDRLNQALAQLFENPPERSAASDYVRVLKNRFRIARIQIVPLEQPDPETKHERLARRILEALPSFLEQEPALRNGPLLTLAFHTAGRKLLGSPKVTDNFSAHPGLVRRTNGAISRIFKYAGSSPLLDKETDPAGWAAQQLIAQGHKVVRVQKGTFRGAAGLEEAGATARAAKILRPLLSLGLGQMDPGISWRLPPLLAQGLSPDEALVRAFLDSLRAPARPAALLPEGLLSEAPYRSGAFSRGELSGDLAREYLEEEGAPTLEKVLQGVAEQVSTPKRTVTPDHLGFQPIRELIRHLFYARGADGRLLMEADQETEFYRWIYRDIPHRLAPKLADRRINRKMLMRALENPFRPANNLANDEAALAIRKLLSDPAGGFRDDPASLRQDPPWRLGRWIKLTLALNLIDYSRPAILQEMTEEGGLVPYVLKRIDTPFLEPLGGERHLAEFIRRILEPGIVLVHLPDNNGELAGSLKLAEALLSANPTLKIRMVLKADNGVMNDASLKDARRLLDREPALYARIRQYMAEGRFLPVAGALNHGTPLNLLPEEAVQALREADLVLSEGEANTWALNRLKKPIYLGLRLKWPRGVRQVFGLDLTEQQARERPPAFLRIDGARGPYYRNPLDAPGAGRRRTILQTLAEQSAAGGSTPRPGPGQAGLEEVDRLIGQIRTGNDADRINAIIRIASPTLYRPTAAGPVNEAALRKAAEALQQLPDDTDEILKEQALNSLKELRSYFQAFLPPAAGLEETEAAMAREMAVAAWKGVSERGKASVGSPLLIFREPDTFDLVPLAVQNGWTVAVDADGPQAEALRKLLDRMREEGLAAGIYAVGRAPSRLLIQESLEQITIRSRRQAFLLLLPPELQGLPLPSGAAKALKYTRRLLDLSA